MNVDFVFAEVIKRLAEYMEGNLETLLGIYENIRQKLSDFTFFSNLHFPKVENLNTSC